MKVQNKNKTRCLSLLSGSVTFMKNQIWKLDERDKCLTQWCVHCKGFSQHKAWKVEKIEIFPA